MLKTHWSPDHRKSVFGVVESTGSLTVDSVPLTVWICWKEATTPGVPIELPLASHTRNFTGTVEPCLNTLLPSALTGCRMVRPAAPRQDVVAGAQGMAALGSQALPEA